MAVPHPLRCLDGNLWSWGTGVTMIPNHAYDLSIPSIVPLQPKIEFKQIVAGHQHYAAISGKPNSLNSYRELTTFS